MYEASDIEHLIGPYNSPNLSSTLYLCYILERRVRGRCRPTSSLKDTGSFLTEERTKFIGRQFKLWTSPILDFPWDR